MNKTLIGISVAMAGLFAFFLLAAPTTEEAALNSAPSINNDGIGSVDLPSGVDTSEKKPLIIGDPNAQVTIVEYGDFKCPSCNSFHHGAGAQIREEYVDKGLVNIEFRNYPFLGPDSGRAARGAYCANEQSVFTAYHDRIYNSIWDEHYSGGSYAAEYDDVFSIDKIVEVLGDAVPDPDALRSCISSTDLDDNIDADIALARQDGIQGTPGFVVNGRPLNGPSNFNTFKVLIDAQLR